MKRTRVAAGLILLAATGVGGFEVPTEQQRLQAIGSTEGVPAIRRKALDPADDFEPLPEPGPQDWLMVHREPGQTFAQFVQSHPNRPDRQRNIIYLLTLGEFPPDTAPPVDALREYAAAFFALEVRVLPPLGLSEQDIAMRRNPATRNRQLRTTDILALLKKRIPDDAFCLLGITMADLYPEASWNFVFGQASLRERVGVYSFARYDPAFYGQPRDKDYAGTLLRRSAKVLVHETAHMFGLQHCIYFRCVCNGSNHLAESDFRPLHECPVDLHKLQHRIGFDVTRRYAALLRFYHKVGFTDEAAWTLARLEWLLGAEDARKLIQDAHD